MGKSHVFYLPGHSKCFFIQIFNGEELKTVVAQLNNLDKSIKQLQTNYGYLNCRLKLFNVQKSRLKLKQNEVKNVYKTQENSKCEVVKMAVIRGNYEGPLINYEGIITEDTLGQCGAYILDRKVALFVTHLSVVTNVKIFSKGDRVAVLNCHLITGGNYGRQIQILCLCGRGVINLITDDEMEEKSMHCRASTELYQHNPVVQIVLEHNLNLESLMLILGIATTFGLFHKEKFDHILGFLDLNPTSKVERSLVQEYLSEPHKCELFRSNSVNVVDLNVVNGIVSNTLRDKKRERISANKNVVQFCTVTCEEEVAVLGHNPILIGIVSTNEKNGQLEFTSCNFDVKKKKISEKVLVTFQGNFKAEYDRKLVKILEFKACIEFNDCSEVIYLIVTKFSVLNWIEESEECGIISKKNYYTVLFKSEPIWFADEQKWFYFCALKTDNNCVIKFARTELHQLVDPGSRIMIEKVDEEKYYSVLGTFLSKVPLKNTQPKAFTMNKFRICTKNTTGIRSKVNYDLTEFEQIPTNELVTIDEAVVAERWLEKPKFDPIRDNSNQDSITFLVGYVLQLKLIGVNSSSSTFDTVSFYLNQWDRHAYPLGIVPKSRIRLENVQKVVSKKNYGYLQSTLFTRINLLNDGIGPNLEPREYSLKCLRDLISDKKMEAFKCFLCLEYVLKVSISAHCPGCNSLLSRRNCSYVGCHVRNPTPELCLKASFHVQDPTGSALLICNQSEAVKSILNWSDAEFQEIQQSASELGELLYLKNSELGLNCAAERILKTYCELLPQVFARQFVAIVRPLKQSLQESENLKLFCLHIL